MGLVLDFLNMSENEGFELAFVEDAEMLDLSANFAGIFGPTNVLAFPGNIPEEAGEIVLNLDAVLREAVLYGQKPLLHLLRLFTHAVLHLKGFEHGLEMYSLTEKTVDYLEKNFTKNKERTNKKSF